MLIPTKGVSIFFLNKIKAGHLILRWPASFLQFKTKQLKRPLSTV